jgi:hypothetical protein
MTAISTANVSDAAEALRQRRKRRRLALAGVLTVIVGAALLTPEMIGGRTGDSRLTTYSAEPQGARVLYELASRLGWHVQRWTQSGSVDPDPRTVVAILDPVQPIGAIEAHRLLERVRNGSGLLYVMSGTSPLNDSLHVKRSLFGGIYEATAAGTAESPRIGSANDTLKARHFASAGDSSKADEEEEASAECAHVDASGGALPLWGDQKVHLFRFSWSGPRPSGTVVFARSAVEEGQRDTTARVNTVAAAGFPVGRGRVVLLSDADIIRNDVIRVCRWGLDVATVRMLEYLATGEVKRDRLVFDEYHQGFGMHPGTLRTIVVYLVRAASGHVLIQAMLGGLVLLLALGPRALPVHDPERVERRSPLEHVTALAQAYSRVGGTRTATSRLLRGVRRRVERGGRGQGNLSAAESDAHFLDNVAANAALTEDVALIRRGLSAPLSRREFEDVGSALERVEHSFLTQRR